MDKGGTRGGRVHRFLHRAYLAGYSGFQPPRWLRRVLAGSCWHRAWLLGRLGFFIENGAAYGPANPYRTLGRDAETAAERPPKQV